MPQPRVRVVQGTSLDYTQQTSTTPLDSGFVSTDALGAKVWAGDAQASLSTPAVSWGGILSGTTFTAAAGASALVWTVGFLPADTASLGAGIYRMQVFGDHTASGRTARLWDGLLEVAATPATSVDTGLITLTYAESALSRLRLSRDERNFLAALVTVASDTIVKWCGQRDFVRQTYTEEYTAELNGYVALRQFPVNAVSRIRSYPQTVLNITGSPSSMQQAWVSYTTTGDWYTNTLTYTGLVLNSVASGVLTATPFLFANYATVGALATAVGNVNGWTANTTPIFGLYPSTDLAPPGGLTSQGALDDDGAQLVAYTEDISECRVDNKTGFLWVGSHRVSSAFGQRWGEDWLLLEDFDSAPIGRVQVTYDAGFSVVPSPVQLATAELVKALVERFRTDHMLLSEEIGGAGSRAYRIAAELVGMLPKPVLQGLSLYRAIRAK
jgi:hypothetical protein